MHTRKTVPHILAMLRLLLVKLFTQLRGSEQLGKRAAQVKCHLNEHVRDCLLNKKGLLSLKMSGCGCMCHAVS